jgi:hypothetical protein
MPQAHSSMPYSYNMLFEHFLSLTSLTEDLNSFASHIKKSSVMGHIYCGLNMALVVNLLMQCVTIAM